MPAYIYTHPEGTSLVRETIVETIPFANEKEAVKQLALMQKGEVIPAEQELLTKYPDALFINKKNEDAKLAQASLQEVQHVLALYKQQTKAYYQNTLLLTKQAVADSVTFETLVIQAIHAVDEVTKIANLMAKRLREWYELYNPEFSRAVHDHEGFATALLEKTKEELLKEIGYTKAITMGAPLEEKDVEEIYTLARELILLYKIKKRHEDYIESLLAVNCPNMVTIAGSIITAKMLSIAGSLQRLAAFPSSTVQLLGAEKALFRHMKTGARPPKYGFLLQHPFVAQAKKPHRGKVARAVADKLSICAKIDYHKGVFMADTLLAQLQTKIKGL